MNRALEDRIPSPRKARIVKMPHENCTNQDSMKTRWNMGEAKAPSEEQSPSGRCLASHPPLSIGFKTALTGYSWLLEIGVLSFPESKHSEAWEAESTCKGDLRV